MPVTCDTEGEGGDERDPPGLPAGRVDPGEPLDATTCGPLAPGRLVRCIEVAWLGIRPPPWPQVVMATGSGHRYAFVSQAPFGPFLAERDERPAIVVVDTRWCAQLGTAQFARCLDQLRGALCLLAWDATSPLDVAWVVESGAVGLVPREADPETLAHALDMILAGQAWLPRWLLARICQAYASVRSRGAGEVADRGWGSRKVARRHADLDLQALTRRERDAITWLRTDLRNRDIAARMGVSVNTVKKHLASAYAKLDLSMRRQEC